MARRILDVGDFANDGTGDSIRVAAIKLNETLAEVYNFFGNGSVLTFGTLTSSTTGNTVLGGDSFRVVGNTGQVSIGTDNPTVLFQVSSNSGVTTYTDQASDVFKIEGNTDQGINISTGDSSNGYIAFSNTSTRAAGALGYDQGLNSLTIFTDNAERLRVDGSGNVGFGTASPLGRLHVENAAASTGWIVRGQTTSVSNESGLYVDASNNMELVARNGSGTLTALIKSSGDSYFNGGNVGIGTASPAVELQVETNSDTNIAIVSGTSGISSIDFGDSDDRNAGLIQYLNTDNAMTFRTSGSGEDMRITSSGKVGIGVTDPSEALEVGGGTGGNSKLKITGGAAAFLRTSDTGGPTDEKNWDLINDGGEVSLRFLDDSTNSYNNAYKITRSGLTVTNHVWYTDSGSERMRINSSGNLGLGTASPTSRLDVKSNSDVQIEVEKDATGGGFIGVDSSNVLNIGRTGAVDLAFKTNNTERLRVSGTGNIGIGTSSPSYKLDVAGIIRSSVGFVGNLMSSNGTKVIDNGTDGTDAKYEGLFWSYGGNKYNTETGTTYTLVRDDAGITKRINNGSGTTITVPANATVAFPIGTYINFVQEGAGQITFSAAGGVTLNHTDSHTKSKSRYAIVTLYKLDTNVWILGGSTAA